ncbi:MAG: STAS domain-containing protein [Acidimicrobiales bacterium]
MVDPTEPATAGPATEAPKLSVELSRVGHTCVLALFGELDCSTIPVLEAYVDQLGSMDCLDVDLDLSDLRALDGAGARVLVGLRHYVTARGGRLNIAGAVDVVMRFISETDHLLGGTRSRVPCGLA